MNSKTRPDRLVVIGGCAAGMSAASKAKRLNPRLEVIAFERTPHVSYSACGIPYFISELVRSADDLVTVTPRQFREERGIDVRTSHDVVAIEPVPRRVTTVDLLSGRTERYEYDKLVIATGGRPRWRHKEIGELGNCFVVQTLADGIKLKRYVDDAQPRHAVIVGGGYIAMELAESFRLRGLSVTVVERGAHIVTQFEPEIADIVASRIAAEGVDVRANCEVVEWQHDNGRITSAALSDGSQLQPDLVLLAIGLSPQTDLAESCGLRLGATGAIQVDWKMRTSNANIYAAGDCTEVRHLVSGKSAYLPLGPTANKQGRVAGENIGGGTAKFPGVVGTAVFKTFSLEVASTGLNLEAARESGFSADKVMIGAGSRAGYFPGNRPIHIAIIFDRRSRRLLGAQIVGEDGVSKRIDIFAAALSNRMTLEEMAYLDLSYAPPFAPVWDPVLVAVNAARRKL